MRARLVAPGYARLVTLGYLLAWRLVRALPERTAYAVFARVADVVHRRGGRGVLRLRGNLARLVPEGELEAVTRAAVRSYLRYWCEAFRLPAWSVEDVVRRTRVVDEPVIREAQAAGRGIVVALPHMGNWDWAAVWAAHEVMPLMTVAERLEPARLYEGFVRYRESLGMTILPLTGAEDTMRRLERRVASGGLVCLLADRDLSHAGVPVVLAGEPARMPRGPAVLARRTGAPLVPVTLAYQGREMILRFHPPVPAGTDAEMMQGVADAFTDMVRAHPEDWHMMQQVFAADSARAAPEP